MEKSKKKMMTNAEIFINFLADRGMLHKYITTYYKKHRMFNSPLWASLPTRAERTPKLLVSNALGHLKEFDKLNEVWLEYMGRTIDYVPQEGDTVHCEYHDEKKCELVKWETVFKEGDKYSFTDTEGNVHDKQTFVRLVKRSGE